MSSYVQMFNDRLDFLEFKQNILLLKHPQHKASVFAQLKLDKFIEIRDFTKSFEYDFTRNNFASLGTYESGLYKIWPPLKSYPDCYILILKSLLGSSIFENYLS